VLAAVDIKNRSAMGGATVLTVVVAGFSPGWQERYWRLVQHDLTWAGFSRHGCNYEAGLPVT